MKCIFKLFVSGETTRSHQAINNLKKIEEHFSAEDWSVEIIDIQRDPKAATTEMIIATPCLIRTYPLPICKIIGDLSDLERVIQFISR